MIGFGHSHKSSAVICHEPLMATSVCKQSSIKHTGLLAINFIWLSIEGAWQVKQSLCNPSCPVNLSHQCVGLLSVSHQQYSPYLYNCGMLFCSVCLFLYFTAVGSRYRLRSSLERSGFHTSSVIPKTCTQTGGTALWTPGQQPIIVIGWYCDM